MKKKVVFLGLVASVLAVLVALSFLYFLRKPNISDESPLPKQENTADKRLLDYNFIDTMLDEDCITKHTVFIYKEPCKLTEGPELWYRGYLIFGLESELENAFNPADAEIADQNDYIFEGQIYHHGWIYFNFSKKYIYYNGRLYRFSKNLEYGTEYLIKNTCERYTGDYKFGDALPYNKFFSGTIIKVGNTYAVKPFEDEPIAALCESVKQGYSTEEGKKVTVEYAGYLEAGNPARVVYLLGIYNYDPKFNYEKTTPDMLDVAINHDNGGYYIFDGISSNTLNNDPTEITNAECVIINTYEKFKNYESNYRTEFNLTYTPEFFEENSLVYAWHNDSTGGNRYYYKDIYIKDNKLCVELTGREGNTDDIGYYSFSVTLAKDKIAKCTDVVLMRGF